MLNYLTGVSSGVNGVQRGEVVTAVDRGNSLGVTDLVDHISIKAAHTLRSTVDLGEVLDGDKLRSLSLVTRKSNEELSTCRCAVGDDTRPLVEVIVAGAVVSTSSSTSIVVELNPEVVVLGLVDGVTNVGIHVQTLVVVQVALRSTTNVVGVGGIGFKVFTKLVQHLTEVAIVVLTVGVALDIDVPAVDSDVTEGTLALVLNSVWRSVGVPQRIRHTLGIASTSQAKATSISASQAQEDLLAHGLASANIRNQLLTAAAGAVVVDGAIAYLTIWVLAAAPVLEESQVQDINVLVLRAPVRKVAIGFSVATVAL